MAGRCGATGRATARRPSRSPRRIAGLATATAILSIGVVEGVHWLAARRGETGAPPHDDAPTEALIVLGYPSTRRGGVHPVQRWRCDIALRSLDPRRTSVVVFTGAARASRGSEAATMAAYARDVLGLGAEVRLEERAMSTWENIAFSVPLIGDAAVIKIVSDPIHAARARAYLRAQHPELTARLVAADNYRPFERWWIKAAGVAYAANLRALGIIRPASRAAPTRPPP